MPEKDGSLKLLPNELVKSKDETEEYICNADLCDDPKMLERVIVGSYILDREVFSMISSERMRSEHIEEIRGIIRKLIGLGIVEETPIVSRSNVLLTQGNSNWTCFCEDFR